MKRQDYSTMTREALQQMYDDLNEAVADMMPGSPAKRRELARLTRMEKALKRKDGGLN